MNTEIPALEQPMKRHVAYKVRIGQIHEGQPNMEAERLRSMSIQGKTVTRVNVIANIVDKFVQEGEKKYASVTLDDATGQIRVKVFGEDVNLLKDLNQGDTVLVIGLIRSWNNELYLTPEILKKKDPAFLLVRKLEIEAEQPKTFNKGQIAELKDTMLAKIKEAEKNGGVAIDQLILDLKEPPNIINAEIKKLLEDGVVYEPRPGKLRYLG